ncbi:MAG TPA: hypothetical protein EYG85_11090 [Crocinitomix sp.]|nr:hypothetical protein [Crocinitomix sp.]
MKKLLVLFFVGVSGLSYTQIHNRMIKFNVGISKEQIGLKETIVTYNDTSSNYFNYNLSSPVFSLSEEFVFNDRFSLGATIGYQYFDIDFNQKKYGTDLFFATINPQLSIFYRKGFEYYIKLRAGLVYRNSNFNELPLQTQRYFPQKTNLITGVTLVGINFFINNKWSLNTELSIWATEIVNIGISYRFFRGDMPNIEDNGYYTD